MLKKIYKWVGRYLNGQETILFLLILGVGIFFRVYKAFDWFEFAHDGDLFSWIVKDIVVDKHLRLIGQMTTAHGIFIGPAFYYLLIPFFLLTKMDPIGTVIPVSIIGILTVASYYYVFSRLFNRDVGLMAAFLYATLLSLVYFDRRIVPSTPTNIWLVWYFYTVLMILRGKYKLFPLLGILVGFVWHIHIALLPVLLTVPAAIVIARKLPSIKDVVLSLLGFLIPSIPLILFETRHGFSQTLSFINSFGINHGGGTGLEKLNLVIIKLSSTAMRLFFYPQGIPFINHSFFVVLLLLSGFLLVKNRLLSAGELVLFYIWIGGIVLYYSLSSTLISEYYFANIEIIFLTIATMFLYIVYKKSKLGKIIVISVLSIVLVKNVYHFVKTEPYRKGYKERKAVAEYIKRDADKRGFPCVAISYITSPGEDVGFRYFSWLEGLKTNRPQEKVPVYTIVLPDELVSDAPKTRFGHIGVILPDKIPTEKDIKEACSGQNTNLTEPMFGFVK